MYPKIHLLYTLLRNLRGSILLTDVFITTNKMEKKEHIKRIYFPNLH